MHCSKIGDRYLDHRGYGKSISGTGGGRKHNGCREVWDQGRRPPVALEGQSRIKKLDQPDPLLRTLLLRNEVLEAREPFHVPHQSPVLDQVPIEGSGQRYYAPIVVILALGAFTLDTVATLDNTVRNTVLDTPSYYFQDTGTSGQGEKTYRDRPLWVHHNTSVCTPSNRTMDRRFMNENMMISLAPFTTMVTSFSRVVDYLTYRLERMENTISMTEGGDMYCLKQRIDGLDPRLRMFAGSQQIILPGF